MNKKIILIAVVVIIILLIVFYMYSGSSSTATPVSVAPSGLPTIAASSALNAPVNAFAGTYGAATITDMGNGAVNVNIGDGNISHGTVSGNSINVQFQNDPGCCTGTLNGSVINWSNGTSWTRTG